MASTDVLSAVIVACIMLSAVVYVRTFEAAGVADNAGVERYLAQQAEDLLAIANDRTNHATRCGGTNLLEDLIIEGVGGSESMWKSRINRFFPPGTRVSLLLENENAYLPIHDDDMVRGITRDIALQPDWSYATSVPHLGGFDGTSQFATSLPAIQYGELIAPKGESILTRLLMDGPTGSQQIAVSGLTALLDGHETSLARTHAQDIAWVSRTDGKPLLSHTLGEQDVTPGAPAIQLKLEVVPGVAGFADMDDVLPLNLTLDIILPVGWSLEDWIGPPGWTELAVEASRLRLGLADNSTGGHGSFTFYMKPPSSPAHPFDVFHARLGNGSLGQSSLVVQYPVSVERGLPRALYSTAPYPVRAGTSALFGVAFANGGAKTTVTQVDIEIPGGYDLWHNEGKGAELFADGVLDPVTDDGGTWSWVNPRLVRWSGERVVGEASASDWVVSIPITSDVSQATAVEPVRSDGPSVDLEFTNGFSISGSQGGGSPGIVSLRVPPDDLATSEADGYAWAENSSLTYDYNVSVNSLLANFDATASYAVSPDAGDLVSLENAMANSSLAVRNRLVPVGTHVTIDANLESVVTSLARANVTQTNLTFDVYSPPSRGCTPTVSKTVSSSSMPLAPVRAATLWDPAGVGIPSLFLVADDGKAYRIDRFDSVGLPVDDGLLRWTHSMAGPGTSLATTVLGPGDRALIVGDAEGVVTRLDPTLGTPLWSVETVDGSGVTGLYANATRGMLVVATTLGTLEQRDIATGEVVGASFAPEGQALSLVMGANDWYAYGGNNLYRLDANLELQASRTDHVMALTVASDSLRAITESARVTYHSQTLVDLLREPVSPEPIVAAAGDLTGDGWNDLVWADEALDVVALDNSGAVLWRNYGGALATANSGVYVPKSWWPLQPGLEMRCPPTDAPPVIYHTEAACAPIVEFYNSGGDLYDTMPLAIHADPTGVSMGHAYRGFTYVSSIQPDGTGRWKHALPTGDIPLALGSGTWLPYEVVLVSTSSGTIQLLDHTTGEPAYDAAPTSFVGRMSAMLPMPAGGFFGVHLVVATLSWEDNSGETRSARLVDWFTAVGADGLPVSRPVYRAVLVVADGGTTYD